MIRVLVVDDHPIVRAGIVGLLDTEPDFEVVGEAESGEAALELVAALSPDVVLMDLRMPGIGGVDATRLIVHSRRDTEQSAAPGTAATLPMPPRTRTGSENPAPDASPRVLVFTTYEDDDQILAAIEAGASGYLVKAAPAEELAAGVRAVAAGQTVLAPSIAVQLARAVGSRHSEANRIAERPALTAREHEILSLVAEGLSNPEIAGRLFIGESTVKTHLIHAFEKLEVNDRTRAVTRAIELGLL